MKRKVFGSVLILLIWVGISLVCAETMPVPDLVGNWTGSSVGHYAGEDGFVDENAFSYRFFVENQVDRAFHGTLYETGIHGDKSYPFSGVIGPDMKTLSMADHDKGYNTGLFIEPDTIELILLVDGSEGLAEVCTLKKE